MVYTTVGMRY